MSWWSLLLAAAVAALFEFSLPVVAVLVGAHVGWLLVKAWRGRLELRRGRAAVRAAVVRARAEVAWREPWILGEATTVRVLPRQRGSGR